MLFQAVMKFLFRLVEIKILVNWGLIGPLLKGFVDGNFETYLLYIY